MEITTRRARPEDAASLAWICYMAGRSQSERSIYDMLYPGPYGDTPDRLSQLEKMLTTAAASWLHHSKFIVAEADGMVAAGLSGFSKEEMGDNLFGAALMELGWTGPDFGAMAERMAPYFKVDPPKPDGVWVVENVAAFPEYRGRGLVNRLLEEVLEEGRSRGHTLAQINIMTGNTPARRAYEKVGFQVDREYSDPSFEDFFGWPGMTSLLLSL